ncbi:MAG: exodeoxyribonuclease V subunit gamma [Neisseriaceae bacterium]|nr:exodeoxyribonuclease V subunit gamma [Neisseriaceae bacterium]
MSISLFRSERIEKLVEKLSDLIKQNPQKNIFLPTEILIASDGMKHFINLSLAQKLGVAANIRYSKVHSFFWRILYESNKNQIKPFRHCYAPEILQWQILKIFQSDKMPETVEKAVHRYLQSHHTAAYDLAETLAKLFEQYMIYRPEWIRAWSKNELMGQLGNDEIWQKDLWLAIQKSLHAPNRVELLDDLLTKLKNKTISFRLPERIFVFAAGALAPLYLHLFNALSKHTHIHLLVLAPSCAYWGDARKSDTDANSLLASLGGQSRDFFDLLSDNNQFQFNFDEENFCENEIAANTSLLHRIQYAIRHYQPIENIEKTKPDNSIVLHSAYSPVRELHAVKDAILYFLQDNPNATPDDIAVLSPNIEAYAPFIEAVFGANAADGVAVPYSLADTAISTGSAYWQAWGALLSVFDSRFEVETVWALLENQAILNHADLSLSDLHIIRQVLENARICFAWDSLERQDYGGGDEDLFTWTQALNRICLGLMLPENNDLWQGVAPLNLDISLLPILSKFAALIEKIHHFRTKWQQKATVSEWAACLQNIHDELLDDESDDASHFLQAVADWQEQCDMAGLSEPVANSVIATHLRHLFAAPTQKNFLRGGISFGSLIPLRSLPFQFLALLGMDANSFPRPSVKLPFDLMAKSPQKGDRSRRDDDRYLFLETLISARKTLYLSFVGKDIQNDSELAPSELIWELGDTLTVLTNSTKEYWEDRMIKHPLQPFSLKYFEDKKQNSGSLNEPQKSFRHKYADALNSINNQKEKQNKTIEYKNTEISFDWITFLRFWKNPARRWLERHADWKSPYLRADKTEREPFVVNHKQHGTEILTDFMLYGDMASERLTAQNYFPAAFLGNLSRQEYQAFAQKIKEENQTLGEVLPFDIQLAESPNDNIHFSGSLKVDLNNQKRIILDGTTKDIYANRLILLWLEHLAANVQWGEITTTIYRPAAGKNACFLPLKQADARRYLSEWVAIYCTGQNVPIYFFPKSAQASVESMFGKNEEEKRKQLKQWVNDKKPLSSAPSELNDFLHKMITEAHKKWLNEPYPESEDDAYKTLFHERNTAYTPLFKNLPQTPVNTAEFIALSVKLLLPLKEHFQAA